jgi:protein TonB
MNTDPYSQSWPERLRALAQPGNRWFPLTLFVAALALGLSIGGIWTASHRPQAASNALAPAAASSVAPDAQHSTLPAPMSGDLSALNTPTSGSGVAHIVPTPTAETPASAESVVAPVAVASIASPAVPTVSSGETPPQIVERSQPGYPADALRDQEQGTVRLRVALDAQGAIEDVQVLESSRSRALDHAAMDSVRTWKFRAAIQNGQPVASTIDVPVEFRLDEH